MIPNIYYSISKTKPAYKSYFDLFCNLKLWPLVTEEQTPTKEGAVV